MQISNPIHIVYVVKLVLRMLEGGLATEYRILLVKVKAVGKGNDNTVMYFDGAEIKERGSTYTFSL